MSSENNGDQPTLMQVFASVLAAMFGVQKRENLERDFKHGRPLQFIIVGLFLTFVLVLTLLGVVSLVLSLAQG